MKKLNSFLIFAVILSGSSVYAIGGIPDLSEVMQHGCPAKVKALQKGSKTPKPTKGPRARSSVSAAMIVEEQAIYYIRGGVTEGDRQALVREPLIAGTNHNPIFADDALEERSGNPTP